MLGADKKSKRRIIKVEKSKGPKESDHAHWKGLLLCGVQQMSTEHEDKEDSVKWFAEVDTVELLSRLE